MIDQRNDASNRNFFAAMREQIAATPLPTAQRRRWRAVLDPTGRRQMRFGVLSGVMLGATAVAAVVVLALSAATNAPPAYAITHNPDGSLTITLSELTRGIPGLNAKFRQLGINETVIPIKADCHQDPRSRTLTMHPNPMFEYTGSITTTYSAKDERQHPADRGYRYVLAAKQLPNGKLLGFIGQLKTPIPSCLPYSDTPSTSTP